MDATALRGPHDDLVLLMPVEVQAVDAFFRDIDRDDLMRRRYPLLREVRPYSFGATVGPEEDPATGDMVQKGSLDGAFDTLRDFYARAATAGNVVIKDISEPVVCPSGAASRWAPPPFERTTSGEYGTRRWRKLITDTWGALAYKAALVGISLRHGTHPCACAFVAPTAV
jgi:hypothetical protein